MIINVIDIGLFVFGSVRNIEVVRHSIMVNIIYKYGNWTHSTDFKGHCAPYTILYILCSSSVDT
jgi:hypothetical protein